MTDTTNLKLKILKDQNGENFLPFSTSKAVYMDGTDQTVDDVIKGIESDIPTVNDATITIQKNSTTVDTFTLNQSSNKTIDISVPTKTSDLTNDDNVVKDASYVHTDNNYTNAEKTKLSGIESNAEVNIIEIVKVNGTALTPDQDRAVDITVAGSAANITYDNTTSGLTADDVQEAIDELADEKVDKVNGKGLSTEDYTTADKTKLAGIEASADVNTIESISVNNSAVTPDTNKNVDITVPTKVSDLNNDSGYITGINSTDVTTALGFTPMNSALKGANSGVAELDATGKVPSSQLPSYVDDVIEVDDYASLPSTGEAGKIYITKDTNKTYRWSGSAYVEISESLALGETSSTAYRGDRGKTAYDHSQAAHAPSNAEHNTIETISLNSTALTPDANRNVDITPAASDVSYDNTITGFASTNMQDVFDEFVGEFDNFYLIRPLPLVYYVDPDEPEEYNGYYNNVVNVNNESGTGVSNDVYIVNERNCTLAHPAGIWINFGNAPSSAYQEEIFNLKHGDIVIVNCASGTAYTVGDRITIIREGKIYTSTVTTVAGLGKRTKLKTEHSLSEVPHHLTNATISHNDFRDDYTHVADVDTVGECFVDGSTLQNLTFPAGTLFYVNWNTINSVPGIIITPTGIIYKATAMSLRGFTLITINNPVDVSNYLAKDNTTAFTPTGDYQPATKKYVDDNAGGSSEVTLITEDTDLLTLNNGIYRVDAPYTNAYLYIPIAQNFVLSEAIDRTNTSSVGKYIRVEQGLVILNDGLYGSYKYHTATLIPTTEMAYTEKISEGTKTVDVSYNNILKLDKTDRRATYFDSIQEYITDETLSNTVKPLIDTYAIHRITQALETASVRFSGSLSINDIAITLSCNFDGAGTYSSVTFPAGTLFFINYTKTALGTPGIIIMPDGTMYEVTSISASGSLVGITIKPYVDLTSNQTIGGVKTFSSVPVCATQPTSNNELANKAYVDAQAGGGSSDAKDITCTLKVGEPTNWSTITWSDFSPSSAAYVWTDGTDTYYSYGTNSSYQKVFNKNTKTWESKTWNNLPSFFNAKNVWTDGTNTYYSSSGTNKVLDKSTSTWNTKTWSFSDPTIDFNGSDVWTDGTNIYVYVEGYGGHFVLNGSSWSEKTFQGTEEYSLYTFDASCVWTDGTDIYYNGLNAEDVFVSLVLNKNTSTWSVKSWTGLTDFYGKYIWTDGTDIYYSNGANQYKLDKSTGAWSAKSWTGLTSFDRQYIWIVDEDVYYSNSNNQYKLDSAQTMSVQDALDFILQNMNYAKNIYTNPSDTSDKNIWIETNNS